MPHVTQLQRLARLVRDWAHDNGTDRDTAVRAMAIDAAHMQLAAELAAMPLDLVRDFCELHAALTVPRVTVRTTGVRIAGVQ